MANKDNAGSGYLVLAANLLTLLPEAVQNEYDQYVADHDFDQAMGILDRHLPSRFPQPAEIFILGPDDHGEELGQEVPYARFEEDVLYIKRTTPKHQTLMTEAGLKPRYYRWTMWG